PNIKRTGWKAKALATALLEDAGVAIIGGPDFGGLGEGYVRLSYANSTENILRALERMGEFLASPKAASCSIGKIIMVHITPRSGLSEEQRLMRQSCRDFVDEVVTPFIRSNWQREWDMNPQARLPPEILQGAEEIGIRTLGVPEEFGGL